VTRSHTPEFWAVCTYFNAKQDRQRRANFEHFLAYLDLPLLVMELGEEGQASLPDTENCRVIPVPGRAGIWQKERLLNLALDKLPAAVTHVAWLDADVVLEDREWPARARELLDSGASLVQLFSVARQVDADEVLENISRSELFELPCKEFSQSFARAQARGLIDDDEAFAALIDTWDGHRHDHVPEERSRPQTGFAWAAKRETLARWRFYEHFVVGGGDRAFCFAAAHRPEVVLRERQLTPAHRAHYLAWARRLAEDGESRIACLDSELRHLWHGSVESRRYRDRFSILLDHDFDPRQDVVSETGAALRWRYPEGPLARRAAAYFRARANDG
jgi:hypothetical protein